MAFEYFLYDTNFNNTLVDRSATSFAPLPPDTGEIFIDFLIPNTQPLYYYRESGATIVLNDQATIDAYLNATNPPQGDDPVLQDQFTGYTATTQTDLDNKISLADNGLTKVGETVVLGGILTGETIIDTSAQNFVVSGTSGGYRTEISTVANNILLSATDVATSIQDNIVVGGGGNGFFRINQTGGTVQSLTLQDSVGIVINDQFSNVGASYADDYSANYTDRSLVDKEYVDLLVSGTTGGTGITGAANGLSVDGDNVVFGGTFTGDTILNYNDYGFTITGNSNAFLEIGNNALFMVTDDTLLNNRSGLVIQNDQIFIGRDNTNTGEQQNISFLPLGNGITVLDELEQRGVNYADNYHANYEDRTLVDKEYVDNQITGVTSTALTGATNGLTATNGVVGLGGGLTGDTVIGLNSGSIEFSGSSATSDNSVIISQFATALFTENKTLSADTRFISNGSFLSLGADNVSGDTQELFISESIGIRITDSVNNRGVEYADDYSGNYTDRSLVDKEYVDNAITGATNPLVNVIQLRRAVPAGSLNSVIPRPLLWDTQEFYDDTTFSHNPTGATTGSTVEVLKNGTYEISYNLNGESADNKTATVGAQIRLNGTTLIAQTLTSSYTRNSTDNNTNNTLPPYLIQLSANDIIEVVAFQLGSADSEVFGVPDAITLRINYLG